MIGSDPRRRSRAHVARCLVLLLSLACASTGSERLPACPHLARLNPLPEPAACDAGELAAYRKPLDDWIESEAGPLLVRVDFDDASKPASACADPDEWRGHTRARKALGARLPELLSTPPGPGCLAGRRLDFNRLQSKLAEIEAAERECQTQAGEETEGAQGGDPEELMRQAFGRCMESRSNWIILGESGRIVLLFAKPEILDPPTVRPDETAARCQGQRRSAASLIACIEEDGWERLR